MYLLGGIWKPPTLVVAGLAVTLGAVRLARTHTVATGGFKVPRHWEALGPTPYMGIFGALLGLGVVTTMPSTTMIALVGWTWHTHQLDAGMLTFGLFTFGRLATTAAMWARHHRRGEHLAAAADATEQRSTHLARAEACTSILLGSILVTAYIQ